MAQAQKIPPQEYYTTVPRYVNGKYVVASPEFPALVRFPGKLKVSKDDMSLIPRAEFEARSKEVEEQPPVIPHYARIDRGQPQDVKENDGKRPSDVDPAAR